MKAIELNECRLNRRYVELYAVGEIERKPYQLTEKYRKREAVVQKRETPIDI